MYTFSTIQTIIILSTFLQNAIEIIFLLKKSLKPQWSIRKKKLRKINYYTKTHPTL